MWHACLHSPNLATVYFCGCSLVLLVLLALLAEVAVSLLSHYCHMHMRVLDGAVV